ncbi:TPA: C39 family peptidase [Serratia odorifera]
MIRASFIITMMLCLPSDAVVATYIEGAFHGKIKQLYDNTCGLSSISFVLNKYYKRNVSELELINKIGIKPEYSFIDLANLSISFGAYAYGVKISTSQLKIIHSPTILYINRFGKDHFVVLLGINEHIVQLYDPAWGYINYTHNQFNRYWRGDLGLGKALVFLNHEVIAVDSNMVYQKNIFIN